MLPLVFRFAASLYSMLPLVFRFAASPLSLHSQRLLLIVISQQSAAILVLFVGRRYYLRPFSRFAAFAAFAVAAKAMASIRFPGGLYFVLILSRYFS